MVASYIYIWGRAGNVIHHRYHYTNIFLFGAYLQFKTQTHRRTCIGIRYTTLLSNVQHSAQCETFQWHIVLMYVLFATRYKAAGATKVNGECGKYIISNMFVHLCVRIIYKHCKQIEYETHLRIHTYVVVLNLHIIELVFFYGNVR